MKNTLFSIAIVILVFITNTSLFSQGGRNIQDELGYRMEKLAEHKDIIPERTYYQLVDKYNVLVAGYNGVMSAVAKKVANGYLLVNGEKKLKKDKDFQYQVQYYQNQAIELFNEVGAELDDALHERRYSTTNAEFLIALVGLAPILAKLEQFLKHKACVAAQLFYEEKQWLTFEQLTQGRPVINNWSKITGGRCVELIAKKGGV